MGNKLVENDVLLEGLNWRYATKAYDASKKVPDADWATIEQAISLAPSSFGIQPFKFIVITDPKVREKLKPAAYGQAPITDASHLVAFAYKKHFPTAISSILSNASPKCGEPRAKLCSNTKTS